MMYGHYLRINQKEFSDFCGNRQLQRALVYGDAEDSFCGCYLGIGFYWHAIDFLINQVANFKSELQSVDKDIVFGGQPIDAEEIWFDFGPIRYFTTSQIKKIYISLTKINPEEIATSYSQRLFVENEIYPDNWCELDRDYIVNQLKSIFLDLQIFLEEATKSNQIIITFITAF